MRALLLITLTLATLVSTADARHRRCIETDSVVGYEQCTRFGDRWASGPTLSWELGLTSLALPIGAIDRSFDDGTMAVASAGTVTAKAARLRNVYGLTPHFYVASELAFGVITSAPALSTGLAARQVMTTPSDMRGHFASGMLAAGTRSRVGPLELGVETAFGPRFVLLTSEHVPNKLFGDGGVALEARAHAGLWLSEHWSTGLMLGTSLLERGDYSVTLGIGLHAFPFDGGH